MKALALIFSLMMSQASFAQNGPVRDSYINSHTRDISDLAATLKLSLIDQDYDDASAKIVTGILKAYEKLIQLQTPEAKGYADKLKYGLEHATFRMDTHLSNQTLAVQVTSAEELVKGQKTYSAAIDLYLWVYAPEEMRSLLMLFAALCVSYVAENEQNSHDNPIVYNQSRAIEALIQK